MKTNELSQKDQLETNGGSLGSMPGATSDMSPSYQPESAGSASGGDGQTVQQQGEDTSTGGYEGPGYDGVSPSSQPHYIK